jgi:N-acetylglucosaminyldiphosphoundecaprenol N-acetyl-beta-D-mannosaminyltransferase
MTQESARKLPQGAGETSLLGVPFSNVSFEELWTMCCERIELRQPGFIVTPNLDHMVTYRQNDRFREAYSQAMLRTPDSTPVMWLARLLGTPLREKLPGSDLVPRMAERAAESGYSVFCFGAAPGVADRAAEIMQQRWPGLSVAGTYCPPLGFEDDPDEKAKALAAVREATPDVCFVALGSPKQEFWMMETAPENAWGVAVGIGAGLDFVCGQRQRAPVFVQKAGLEWLWRTALEPRRLGPRYWNDAVTLGPLAAREICRRWLGLN